jgi:hypothetical protein
MSNYAKVYDHTPLVDAPVYTVFGVEKDGSDQIGTPKPGATDVTFDEALDYADRNESPDNHEFYVIRYRVEAQS